MQSLPFAQPGRFYRGNLHTHSTRSDGRCAPEEVIAAYRAEGYDFLALTDHFLPHYDYPITDTRPLRDEAFTTIIGAELHAPATEKGDPWHILAVGLPLDFAPNRDGETAADLAARAAAAGAYVALAHPAWYNLTLDDLLSIEAADAVEVYNETCAQDNDRGDSWHACDMLLGRGRRLLACATDDAHFSVRDDRFGGWVQVRSTRLDPAALLAALKAGHYYSSQGPTIERVAIDGDYLEVACSPAAAIFVSGVRAANRREVGEGITAARLPIEPFADGYCRVTVLDAAGKRAWTNPIWLT